MSDSKDILITEVKELIYLSVSLSDKQKSNLVLKLSTFSLEQLEKCKKLFLKEQNEVSRMFTQKLKKNPKALENYNKNISHNKQTVFKKAEQEVIAHSSFCKPAQNSD
jgi:hypothetical protein